MLADQCRRLAAIGIEWSEGRGVDLVGRAAVDPAEDLVDAGDRRGLFEELRALGDGVDHLALRIDDIDFTDAGVLPGAHDRAVDGRVLDCVQKLQPGVAQFGALHRGEVRLLVGGPDLAFLCGDDVGHRVHRLADRRILAEFAQRLLDPGLVLRKIVRLVGGD